MGFNSGFKGLVLGWNGFCVAYSCRLGNASFSAEICGWVSGELERVVLYFYIDCGVHYDTVCVNSCSNTIQCTVI